MQVRLFGRPEVLLAGQMVPLPLGKPLALLCYLAATAPHASERRHLSALLWEDAGTQHLRQALYTLRRALGPLSVGVPVGGASTLVYTGTRDTAAQTAAQQTTGERPGGTPGLFLSGLEHLAAPAFTRWLAEQRHHWATLGASGQPLASSTQSGLSPAQLQPTVVTDDWLQWARTVWQDDDPEALSRLLYGHADWGLEIADRLARLPQGRPQPPHLGPTEAARRLLHGRAAQMLAAQNADAGRIAGHFLQAQDASGAHPYLLISARDLLASGQFALAQAQAQRALWTSSAATQQVEVLFVLESVADLTRQPEQQRWYFTELERLAAQLQHDDLLYRLALLTAQRRQAAGKLEQAAQAAQTAAGIARRLGRRTLQAEAQLLGAVCALGAGRLEEAATSFRALLRTPHLPTRMRARLHLGTVCGLQGRRAESVRYLEQALTLARKLGHRPAVASALNNLAGGYEGLARYQDAVQMARDSYQFASQQDDRRVMITSLLNMAEFHRSSGAYGPCWNTLQEALELVGPDTPPELHSALLARLGMLEGRFGRRRAALNVLRRALALAQSGGGPRAVLIAEMQLALLQLPAEAARTTLHQIAARFRHHGYSLLADMTELQSCHHDAEASPEQLLAVAAKHRRHAHPHLAWLAAVQGVRATGQGGPRLLGLTRRFQFAEIPEVLRLLGQTEQAAALRLEQASGLPMEQRQAFLKRPI